MFNIFVRFHRHKDYEKELSDLSEDVGRIMSQLRSMKAGRAVAVRESNKDAEIKSIERQLRGTVIASLGKDGQLEDID